VVLRFVNIGGIGDHDFFSLNTLSLMIITTASVV
jgi:hypothetical protein